MAHPHKPRALPLAPATRYTPAVLEGIADGERAVLAPILARRTEAAVIEAAALPSRVPRRSPTPQPARSRPTGPSHATPAARAAATLERLCPRKGGCSWKALPVNTGVKQRCKPVVKKIVKVAKKMTTKAAV